MTDRRPEANIRRLLRLLRHPHLLEREALALRLRAVLKAASGRDALLWIVDQTFGSTEDGRRFREIVMRCDIQGQKSRLVAAAMGLSLRHFFRCRAEAISALALAAERLCEVQHGSVACTFAKMTSAVNPHAAAQLYKLAFRSASDSDVDAAAADFLRCSIWSGAQAGDRLMRVPDGAWRVLATVEHAGYALLTEGHLVAGDRLALARTELAAGGLGGLHAGAAFALTCYEILEAHRRADVGLSASLVARLPLLCGDDERLQTLTLVEQAHQACVEGAVSAASARLIEAERRSVAQADPAVLARLASTRALLHFLGGSYEDALVYAQAAAAVLASMQPAYALLSAVLAGRAALLCDKPWEPPAQLCARFPAAWMCAFFECIRARKLLRSDLASARRCALHAMALVRNTMARGCLAFAQATLAAVAEAQRHELQARRLRTRAWQIAVSAGDQVVLHDLFVPPCAAADFPSSITA